MTGEASEASIDCPTMAIVACGPQLEIALGGAGLSAPSLVRLAGVSPRSTLILAAADLLVEDAGFEPSAVARVVISCGPGSFTGIRSGIATAQGLAAANGSEIVAYDSLLAQAARCPAPGEVRAAQPGRRGEIYARTFRLVEGSFPQPMDDIEIVRIDALGPGGPWIAAEGLELGRAERAVAVRSAAEALLVLVRSDAPPRPVQPLYVEGPPIQEGPRR